MVANLGEGNMPAMVAFKIAAEVIENNLARDMSAINLSKYHRRCMKTFGRYLTHVYYVSQLFHHAMLSEYIRYKLLKYMYSSTSRHYQNLFNEDGCIGK
jgi:flavin-dependent dehydrogenase